MGHIQSIPSTSYTVSMKTYPPHLHPLPPVRTPRCVQLPGTTITLHMHPCPHVPVLLRKSTCALARWCHHRVRKQPVHPRLSASVSLCSWVPSPPSPAKPARGLLHPSPTDAWHLRPSWFCLTDLTLPGISLIPKKTPHEPGYLWGNPHWNSCFLFWTCG